ncbi:MAG: phosphatase PAP2 family protein [Bacteroidales bacterium]|nr:phosphatase PAP2 family protein [Bacteroidales bacterium]
MRLFYIFCFVLFFSSSFSQTDSLGYNKITGKEYFFSYLTDTRDLILSPGKWKPSGWGTFAALLGGTAIVYIYDKEIYDFVRENKSPAGDWVSKYIAEPFGSGLYAIPILGMIYASGAINKNFHTKNIALTGAKAVIIGTGVSLVAKHIFRRHRPGNNDPPDPYRWEGPLGGDWENDAFPSGHTTLAFTLASSLSYSFREQKWVGIISYSLAAFTGLSRIYDGDHWPTDVIAGAVLGTYIGRFIAKKNLGDTRIGLTTMMGRPAIYASFPIR